MRLLLLSGDKQFIRRIKPSLKQINYQIDCSQPTTKLEFWTKSTDYDLIIIEHFQNELITKICTSIRAAGKTMPLMVVVESLSSKEAVQMFNCGVDDYTNKFAHNSEIVARVKSLLRRPKQLFSDIIKIYDLVLDCTNFTVSRGKKTVYLTKKEFGILEYLLRNQGRVMTRTNLIEHVWDINADVFSNTLETHILNLRKKIERPGRPKIIETITGRGYKIATKIAH